MEVESTIYNSSDLDRVDFDSSLQSLAYYDTGEKNLSDLSHLQTTKTKAVMRMMMRMTMTMTMTMMMTMMRMTMMMTMMKMKMMMKMMMKKKKKKKKKKLNEVNIEL